MSVALLLVALILTQHTDDLVAERSEDVFRELVLLDSNNQVPEGKADDSGQRRGHVFRVFRSLIRRDGEKDEATIVANGERAAKVAVLMIAGRGTLHAGDQLTVSLYDKAD